MDQHVPTHDFLDCLQTLMALATQAKDLLATDQRGAGPLLDRLLGAIADAKSKVVGPDESAQADTGGLPSLRVVVVEDNLDIHQFLTKTIETFGHEIVGNAMTGADMVQLCLRLKPDLVVFDIHLPDIDGLRALQQVMRQRAVAAVAVTGDRSSSMVRRAVADNILAYLLKPVNAQQLASAIQIAWARYQEFCALRRENQSLQQTLEDRKLVERAKGILMRRQGLTEDAAFHRLRQASQDRRVPMADLARDIINGVGTL